MNFDSFRRAIAYEFSRTNFGDVRFHHQPHTPSVLMSVELSPRDWLLTEVHERELPSRRRILDRMQREQRRRSIRASKWVKKAQRSLLR